MPRNGYINRLQAWASSSILAEDLSLALEIAWETERIAAAEWWDLFDPKQVNGSFCDISVVNNILGKPHSEWARYLTFSSDRSTLVLAGHDRGEQAFIPQLLDALAQSSETQTLIIIAGGKFHARDVIDFETRRQNFYSEINWVSEISETATRTLNRPRSCIGLHVRGTDHARSAPTQSSIKHALLKLAQESGLGDIYIAADTRKTRDLWHQTAEELKLRPWSFDTSSYERDSVRAGIDAMIEWNLLKGTQGLIYSSISSFAEEASVASGFHYRSIGLSASPMRQRIRKLQVLLMSAVSKLKGFEK